MSEYFKKALMLSQGKKVDDKVIDCEKEGFRFTANSIVTCPKCGRRLLDVGLFGGNSGKYCPSHRITIPNAI